MCNLNNRIIDRTIILEWGNVQRYIGDFQDYYGIDERGYLCSIKINLLNNANSKIINRLPFLFDINNNDTLNISDINISDFHFREGKYNNIQQYLCDDTIIFKYSNTYNRHLIYKKMSDKLFLVFTKDMFLEYIIITKINDLLFNNSIFLTSKFLRELYFSIYTHDEDDVVETLSIIESIKPNISFKNIFKTELEDMEENLNC